MKSAQHPSPRWFTSSYSTNQGGNCVETAAFRDSIGVRDSKDLGVGHLTVEPASWVALIGSLKSR
ncbi:DUF397 domain-containing protein [Embleya sp. NBC_00896]|uniref:DUF397 domain-containing protein n=1 Tax=Embleya sp. NBC_00896 TaxID=2975961 RepID=UPI003863A00F|nr:DUF397 domain-containing protein [Embleya sp. NBC_00896]